MTKKYYPNLLFVSSCLQGKDQYCFDNARVLLVKRGSAYKNYELKTDVSSRGISLYIYELVLEATSFEAALFVTDLIKCGLTLMQSEQTLDIDNLKMNIELSDGRNRKTINAYQKVFERTWCFGDDSLLHAIKIAQLSRNSPQNENAILKFDMARKLVNINPLDFHPYNDYSPRMYFHSEQMGFAYAIISSYAVLEEIGLEIRASRKKPSTINGEWNLPVLEDLQVRLVANGIDINKTIPWLVRGEMNRPFKKLITQTSNELCEWSDGETIKDFELPICEAILELSYIRDTKASHGVQERIYDLTVYDVENAYSLVRAILLSYFNVDIINYEMPNGEEIDWEPASILTKSF